MLLVLPTPALAGAGALVQLTDVVIAGQSSTATLTVRRGPVDLAKLAITDMDGEATPLSATSRELATGATVVLTWPKAASVPGAIPITGHVLAGTEDQLVIELNGSPHDAVAWSNRDGTIAKAEVTDLNALVTSGQWVGGAEGDLVPINGAPAHLRRRGETDTQSAKDWEVVADDAGAAGGAPSPSSTTQLPSSGPTADLIILSVALAILLRSGREIVRHLRGG
jgi:hypothetical protein